MNTNIDVGNVVSRVFDIYRDQAGVLLPAAAAIFLINALLTLVLSGSIVLSLLSALVQLILIFLYQGMVVNLVSDVQDGRRDSSVGDLFRAVGPVLLPLIAASILASIALAIGFLLLIVPFVILLTIWAVLVPVLVLERPGVFAAFGRSQHLVKGYFWPVLGVIVVFFLIFAVVSFVLGLIGAAIGDVGQVITSLIANLLTAPLTALAAAVLYFALREAKGEVGAPGAPGTLGQPAAGQPPTATQPQTQTQPQQRPPEQPPPRPPS